MATLFNKKWTRTEFLNYVGDLSQVAGIKLGEWSDGNERGLRVADFRSGSGLAFTVLLDRGMDIGPASYKGLPLAWISPTGFGHPMHFEPEGINWLRTFGAGLLTGCGLTSVGSPSEDEGESFGQHGRLSNLPAQHVGVDEIWENDECSFVITGVMRQARVFGENLRLKRRISVGLGSNSIAIKDVVENLGKTASPLMILYHINLGFPLLSENAELVGKTLSIEARDAIAEAGINEWMRLQPPTPGYQDQVLYHDLPADENGWAGLELVNRVNDLRLGVRFQKATLPYLVQWKSLGQGTYVLGLEPANCHVSGRSQERARGTLQFLQPGEAREFQVEIAVSEAGNKNRS
jgi:hypothetical protein